MTHYNLEVTCAVALFKDAEHVLNGFQCSGFKEGHEVQGEPRLSQQISQNTLHIIRKNRRQKGVNDVLWSFVQLSHTDFLSVFIDAKFAFRCCQSPHAAGYSFSYGPIGPRDASYQIQPIWTVTSISAGAVHGGLAGASGAGQ
jgi:hypothetical protein